ncbi:unnamed protein product [Clavelina lepadiformis]|uniref:Kinesin motor domain-containing protein n=1 Tax=Clavelina lepadiformis TaxID=159417 RepID=A0ABP0GC01_CLALP
MFVLCRTVTHSFQSFLMAYGRACMIVNVNQSASTFNETMHAVKFSAMTTEVKVPKLRRSQELLDAIMAKKARKARRAIGCEQVLVEESDKESADNSDQEEESSDKEHDDASWNKREVVGFINLLQDALKKEIISNVESKLQEAQTLVKQKDAGTQ